MCSRLGFPRGHLGHSSHATTPKSRVLVAIPPAVDSSLDKTTLSAQARIELCKCPANSVALGLVVETVALVLVLGAASTRVHTVLSLEVLRKLVNIDRLDVAANSVLHLDPVTGVLKCDPLNTILVLSNNQRSGRRNGTRGSVGVDVGSSGGTCVHVWSTNRRSLRSSLRRATQS
jgi:hypothetical protein